MSEKVIVVGAGGMLGGQLVRELVSRGREVLQAGHVVKRGRMVSLDITDEGAVAKLVRDNKCGVVYNCAAFTDVDGAEDNEELATKINGQGAGNLARACRDNDVLFVHVSTDYVFDGCASEPYRPDGEVGPRTAYGRSKLVGEELIGQAGGKWVIVRTAWLYGSGGGNFVDMIMKLGREKESLKVVDDQIGCPTYTVDLARCLADLADKGSQGIYHFCNGAKCSWYDFARAIIEIAGIECEIHPCTSSEYPRKAKRPAYSVLDCEKTFEVLGRRERSWKEALSEYIEEGRRRHEA